LRLVYVNSMQQLRSTRHCVTNIGDIITTGRLP